MWFLKKGLQTFIWGPLEGWLLFAERHLIPLFRWLAIACSSLKLLVIALSSMAKIVTSGELKIIHLQYGGNGYWEKNGKRRPASGVDGGKACIRREGYIFVVARSNRTVCWIRWISFSYKSSRRNIIPLSRFLDDCRSRAVSEEGSRIVNSISGVWSSKISTGPFIIDHSMKETGKRNRKTWRMNLATSGVSQEAN